MNIDKILYSIDQSLAISRKQIDLHEKILQRGVANKMDLFLVEELRAECRRNRESMWTLWAEALIDDAMDFDDLDLAEEYALSLGVTKITPELQEAIRNEVKKRRAMSGPSSVKTVTKLN